MKRNNKQLSSLPASIEPTTLRMVYKNEEVIGKHISIFYTPESIATGEPEHNLQTAVQQGSFETEGWRVRKDGSRFWADVLITAVYDEYGKPQGFTKVTRDFSLHKSAEDEVKNNSELVEVLKDKCGRFVVNGVPTGVEVALSMHHGGPYPATTDSRFTSVGADGIKRFARPICFQNWSNELLPAELKNENPLALWRTVNNELTKGSVPTV